jgi:hypothetical protein
MPTYVSYGNVKYNHEDELAGLVGGHTNWTVNKNARPSDRVVFYITWPRSAFVGVGAVKSKPRYQESGPWAGKFMARVDVDGMASPGMSRLEAERVFPDWGWLRTVRPSVWFQLELRRSYSSSSATNTHLRSNMLQGVVRVGAGRSILNNAVALKELR